VATWWRRSVGSVRLEPALPAVAWTKDTDQILAKLNSGNTTATSDHEGDIPERWPRRRSRPT
jgi:hypothetical protein